MRQCPSEPQATADVSKDVPMPPDAAQPYANTEKLTHAHTRPKLPSTQMPAPWPLWPVGQWGHHLLPVKALEA